jgi:hypothetical protein
MIRDTASSSPGESEVRYSDTDIQHPGTKIARTVGEQILGGYDNIPLLDIVNVRNSAAQTEVPRSASSPYCTGCMKEKIPRNPPLLNVTFIDSPVDIRATCFSF